MRIHALQDQNDQLLRPPAATIVPLESGGFSHYEPYVIRSKRSAEVQIPVMRRNRGTNGKNLLDLEIRSDENDFASA